jgi:hypothetical protein
MNDPQTNLIRRIDRLEGSNQRLEESNSRLEESSKRIEQAIIGDAEMGHTGLVDRVKSHGVRIRRLETYVIWMSGAAAFAALAYNCFKDLIFK